MVCFTCNRCGASLKKKEVDKHRSTRCKPLFLTCVDCLKDFGNDYIKHFVCVSEKERYGANGLKSKTMTKQQRWAMLVHQTCNKVLSEGQADKLTRSLLTFLTEYPTIPDKEKPFTNFVMNNRRWPLNIIVSVWHILQKAKEEEAKKNANSNGLNGTDETKIISSKTSCSDGSLKQPMDEGRNKDETKQEEISRKSSSGDLEDDTINQNEAETNVAEVQGEDPLLNNKLSKKERKEKKKKQKYEAQLQEIMNEAKPDVENMFDGNGYEDSHPKKLKNIDPPVVSEEESTEKTSKKKKNKKRKHNEMVLQNEAEDHSAKKIKTSASESNEVGETRPESNGNSKEKFSWESTILRVLESKDKEISLKRLSKKVINEYLASLGEDVHIDESKIGAKFHKKLSKMHNVMVHKDRVKIKTSRD